MAIIPNLQAIKRAAEIGTIGDDGSGMRFDLVEISPVDGGNRVTVRAADEISAIELQIPAMENGAFDRPVHFKAFDLRNIKSTDANGQALTREGEAGTLKIASRQFDLVSTDPEAFPPVRQAVEQIHAPSGARVFVQLHAKRLEDIVRALRSIKAETIELSIPLEGDEFAPVGFEAIPHDWIEGRGLAILSPVAPISRPALAKRSEETQDAKPAPVRSPGGVSETFRAPAGMQAVRNAMRETSQEIRELTAPAPAPSISLDSILNATIQGSAADPIPQVETDLGDEIEVSDDDEETPAPVRQRSEISAKVARGTGPSGNGIEITFSYTPSIETRADLKRAGFRWLGRSRLWYAKRSTGSERMAQIIENVFPTMD